MSSLILKSFLSKINNKEGEYVVQFLNEESYNLLQTEAYRAAMLNFACKERFWRILWIKIIKYLIACIEAIQCMSKPRIF